MAYLFIDTETTSFPKKYGDIKQDGQARVTQIAMLLTDGNGRSMAEYSTLIKPDGWVINEEAAKVTGFSNELCELWGVSCKAAFNFYLRMAGIATKIIAHNIEFDRKMMQIEAAYCEQAFPQNDWFCTMHSTAPLVNIPPTEKMIAAGFNKPKDPKLEESLQFMCGRSLGDTAHDAMYDVKACRDIYFELLKIGEK